MKTSNWVLLITVLILAFVPLVGLGYAPIARFDYVWLAGGFPWLAAAIIFYRRFKTLPAALIFALAPVAFGPLIFFLLIYIGVMLSHGNF